ncbi:E3 ubiquitin-protein ligase RHA2A [Acorus calamus]|uniref:E3 ubiquitin-protein ligase RHA2A n=1 Tax=Acorus calamus TaxID=4465 RepID=A0AAV9D4C6_ACOCL|nr:E3 ubiquitin-protein ligase RHA2A [Acorus calamus]
MKKPLMGKRNGGREEKGGGRGACDSASNPSQWVGTAVPQICYSNRGQPQQSMTEEEMELDISHAQGEDDVPASTLVDSVIGEQLGVTLYKRASNDEGDVMQCVVCLCEMEEGDEIRKLNCEHLFHRACLDKWFEHRRSTCPLCRGNLVSWEAEARVGGATDDDDDVLSSILPFVVCIHSSWWVL